MASLFASLVNRNAKTIGKETSQPRPQEPNHRKPPPHYSIFQSRIIPYEKRKCQVGLCYVLGFVIIRDSEFSMREGDDRMLDKKINKLLKRPLEDLKRLEKLDGKEITLDRKPKPGESILDILPPDRKG